MPFPPTYYQVSRFTQYSFVSAGSLPLSGSHSSQRMRWPCRRYAADARGDGGQ
jgi:hypothetical protein